MKNKKVYLICFLFGLGMVMGGCAGSRQVASSEVPNAPNEASSPAKTSFKQAGHYVVKPHDCLWTIAGKSSIYGDPFQWPLLYKANRDLIQDPDLIYPRQKLQVAEGLSQAQIVRARQLAENTPAYKPHKKRRGGNNFEKSGSQGNQRTGQNIHFSGFRLFDRLQNLRNAAPFSLGSEPNHQPGRKNKQDGSQHQYPDGMFMVTMNKKLLRVGNDQ